MEFLDSEELNPSSLGTSEYWSQAYQLEFKNFQENGDVGEIWFGKESNCRIIRWLTSNQIFNKTDAIIDIGCGNGITLISIAKLGYTNLLGIDYCAHAVELATCVAEEHKTSSHIRFEVCDILASSINLSNFTLAIDKGTYDAISLHPCDAAEKRKKYIENVHKILKPEGYFIIVSCNWTEAELSSHFMDYFKVFASISNTPQFQFGGRTGKTTSSIVFYKIVSQ